MIAIIKKEFKSYLFSPIGYVFIGSFLLMLSFLFYINVYSTKTVRYEDLFYNGSLILTFIIPILTMRMFAEEKKNGTDQLIITAPVSITSIVIGKFIAATLIVFITEIISIMYFIILSYFGNPSIKVAILTLFGFLLLSMSYISVGMFISSITENQIVAGVATTGIFISFLFLPIINKTFNFISLIKRFNKFTVGIIEITDFIFFASYILLFVIFTIISIKRGRINAKGK